VSDSDELAVPIEEPAVTEPELPVVGAPDSPAPIHVQLLGAYQIRVHGAPIRTGLFSTARELLAFYLLHPLGASADTAIETLWPDTPARGADERFRNALKNLRGTLQGATGLADVVVLHRDGEIYRIDPTMLDTDLWHFQAALRAARAAPPEARVAALHDAIDHCHGHLLDGYAYDWIEPIREDLRRRALDAISELAEHHAASGDTAVTLDLVERAIQLDPYAETFYRHSMRVHMDEGRPDAANRLFAQLTKGLRELEVEPSDETCQILDSATSAGATKRSAHPADVPGSSNGQRERATVVRAGEV
jgi:DNA-binding SARP family transcriptional activator